ncbi:DUF1775 domain-containing protein [Actinoplanes sp. TFC3]|uniref:DUF1775 domain-containing protein n=1 Tax=Actinoplanes sp. TFC3 TaxID=1710355 RepID=UPI00082EA2FE|nr:DUF1775 domain-containing protein [Actinoplanes sp. TFC3]
MTRLEKPRRAAILAATVAAGVLGLAAPAVAGVTVNPPSAPQGSGQDLAFRVTNTASTPITKVKLVLPVDQPLAEIYPLSVDDWAPVIETKQLSTPVTATDGTKLTQTTASITWVAAPGKSLAPGGSAELTAAMGPMPSTSDMAFTVQATYADPAKGVPLAPVKIALTPAQAGQEYGGHAAHSGTSGGTADSSDVDDATFAALAASANSGPSVWSIAGWVVGGLAVAFAVAVLIRSGRRLPEPDAGEARFGGEEPAEEPAGADKELATAGGKPKTSGWRYQE